jgi:outer membrane lipoprotein-sorting protein
MGIKHHKDEQGVAHLLLIVLAVIVIAGVGVTAWRVTASHKATPTKTSTAATTTSSSTAVSSTANASCLATYHDANLCKFASNSTDFDKTSYTATITGTQSGTTSTLTLKNDGKGNTELSGSANGQSLNSITLDGVTYIQTGSSGTWLEYPSGTTAPTSNPTSSMDIGVGNSGITFKALGTAACGSLTCYKYQVTDSSTPTATQYAWFDNKNYELRQWQYTDGSGNTDVMTVSYGTVNITKPSPVQSVSSYTAQ